VTMTHIDGSPRIEKLERVWTSAYGLVHSHFQGDLADSTLQVCLVVFSFKE